MNKTRDSSSRSLGFIIEFMMADYVTSKSRETGGESSETDIVLNVENKATTNKQDWFLGRNIADISKWKEAMEDMSINSQIEMTEKITDIWESYQSLVEDKLENRILSENFINSDDPITYLTSKSPLDVLKLLVDLCENHVSKQSKSVQEITVLCSKITGFEFYCNQIVTFCNQIISETLCSTCMIVNLCKSFANINLLSNQNGNMNEKNLRAETSEKHKESSTGLSSSFSIPSPVVSDYSTENHSTIRSNKKNSKKKPRKSQPVKLDVCSEGPKQDNSSKEFRSVSKNDDIGQQTLNNKMMQIQLDWEELERSDSDEDTKHKAKDPDWSEYNHDMEHPKKTRKSSTRSYSCCICSKTYKSEKLWKKHEEAHRDPEKEKSLGKGRKFKKPKLKCKFCDMLCHHPSDLKRHIRTHTGEKPYICEICGKGFAQTHGLTEHQMIHLDYKPFSCEHCDYTSRTKRELKYHAVIHSGEKSFQCDECGKQFGRNDSLYNHMRIHSSIKKFQCKFCPKKFGRSGHLKQHERIHNDIMPFSCEICGKQSRQAYNIVVHMRTHTGQKPYKCENCGKQFAHNVSLRQHKTLCNSSNGQKDILQSQDIPCLKSSSLKSPICNTTSSNIPYSKNTDDNNSSYVNL